MERGQGDLGDWPLLGRRGARAGEAPPNAASRQRSAGSTQNKREAGMFSPNASGGQFPQIEAGNSHV